MLPCFTSDKQNAIPLSIISCKDFLDWKEAQNELIKQWMTSIQFRIEPGSFTLLPGADGKIARVLCLKMDTEDFWVAGGLPLAIPEGTYVLDELHEHDAIAWGLGAYQFTRYKKPRRKSATLYVPDKFVNRTQNIVTAIYQVRDWINTPTDDLGPTEFANSVEQLAREYGADFQQIIGDALLAENYASIYTVGRASDDPPRLLDLRWGKTTHPKVTLVGKGVCFDSGGLNIKTGQYMSLMKKDMGGAAHALGLARMIMTAQLPVCLRVLLPVVENVIGSNAYKPGDIIKSRKGMTIEIGNTDAEGRVILADALTEGASEHPELLIDISTLTGAARIAVGPDLPAVFCNQDALFNAVAQESERCFDPMWRLPLFSLYREYLDSRIADINNMGNEPYAGAITAALFLKEFVPDDIPWLHFDLMAWNIRARPGRPAGAEAFALRALFGYLENRFS